MARKHWFDGITEEQAQEALDEGRDLIDLEDNPELSAEFIAEVKRAKAEVDAGNVEPYEFDD